MSDNIRKVSPLALDGPAGAPPAADPDRTKRRARSYGRAGLTFFGEFLRHPGEIASVAPSSRFLERRLVEVAEVARARLVVELGPGTGGTTRAILRALSTEARLLAIDVNPRFAALLRSVPDGRLAVHTGSAVDIGDALAQHGLLRPDVVLSGIPFSTMPPAIGRRILRAAWHALGPGGRFVAYQFRASVADLAREIMGAPDVVLELRNVPPMRVFCWRKRAVGTPSGPAE